MRGYQGRERRATNYSLLFFFSGLSLLLPLPPTLIERRIRAGVFPGLPHEGAIDPLP